VWQTKNRVSFCCWSGMGRKHSPSSSPDFGQLCLAVRGGGFLCRVEEINRIS
jgi:hypothetical protein